MKGRADNAEAQLCVFYVGAQLYAVDLKRVDEILRPAPLTRLPEATDLFEGVAHVKGELVPVIDARKLLHAEGSPPPKRKPKLLICWIGRRKLGVQVDGVSEVMNVTVAELKPAPRLSANAAVIGMCGPPEEPRLLLDLRALLDRPAAASVRSTS